MEYRVYTILYSSTAVFVTKSAHSLRSFALTARFARSTELSALRAIEHYRGRVLNHGRTCQCCDMFCGRVTIPHFYLFCGRVTIPHSYLFCGGSLFHIPICSVEGSHSHLFCISICSVEGSLFHISIICSVAGSLFHIPICSAFLSVLWKGHYSKFLSVLHSYLFCGRVTIPHSYLFCGRVTFLSVLWKGHYSPE